jgi:3-hydroxybutyryl-CoA dehydrogenase
MGQAIDQVFATFGFDITLVNITLDLVNEGLVRIQPNLSKVVGKGKTSSRDMRTVIGRINTGAKLTEISRDTILRLRLLEKSSRSRKKIFEEPSTHLSPETVVASNTSSIPITELAATCSKNPSAFIGMHFFNPVPVMKLVQVVRGLQTKDK